MKDVFIISLIAVIFSVTVTFANDKEILPPGDSPPSSVIDRVRNAGKAADYDSATYIIVLDSSLNRISEEGVAKTNSYMIYKILTEDGCKEMSVLRWHYEPMSSFIEIHEVNLIRGDSIISLDISEIIDLPAPQDGIYWSDRIKLFQLPRLYIGDGIEIKSYRKGYSYALLDNDINEPPDDKYIPPMPGEYFDIVLFEAKVPIVEKIYTLSAPSSKRIHSQIYNGPMYSSTSYSNDTTTYAWWAKDMPAWKLDRYHPDSPDLLSKVVITTAESWEAKSRWFFEVNEPQFEYTPAIKAKVDGIFEDAGVNKGSDEAKAFELVHWVAQNIRYSGQTMGEGEGFTLHPGDMIFEQRSGVCKDIAGMLITMMRAAGLDSYAAMTMAGSRIEDIPADQFNHCVVALRKDDGSFTMYDPTWVPFNKDIWSKYETEQHYLIGTSAGEDLSQIEYSPAEESVMKVRNKCKIFKDGSLEGVLSLTGTGTRDSRLRGFLHRLRLSDNEHYIARIIGSASNRVEIIKIEHGDILDFNKNMWWKIQYKIPEYAMLIDDGYEFNSPMLLMNSQSLYGYISYNWPEKRKGDLFFYSTTQLDAEEEIKLPGGFKVKNESISVKEDETYVSTAVSSGMNGNKFIVKQDIKIKRRQIPENSYKSFRKAMKEANEFTETDFRAEKGER